MRKDIKVLNELESGGAEVEYKGEKVILDAEDYEKLKADDSFDIETYIYEENADDVDDSDINTKTNFLDLNDSKDKLYNPFYIELETRTHVVITSSWGNRVTVPKDKVRLSKSNVLDIKITKEYHEQLCGKKITSEKITSKN